MKTTKIYSQNLQAYKDRKRVIANKGGTRSSKTYSILQSLYTIMMYSKIQRIITVVSHSLPHLHGGAIRDFESILTDEGVNIDHVRTKNPYIYKIGKSIMEFVGFDKPGKALGAARDILFINEANKMNHAVCHQLMTRTKECIWLDWNPSNEFWFEDEGYSTDKDTLIIHSTFFDNIHNLTWAQIEDLKKAKRKADNEKKKGKEGYWSNWWKVYGKGEQGILEGVIFQNWEVYTELPDAQPIKLFGIDWGGNDPTVVVELSIYKNLNRLYVKELLYQPQILSSKLVDLLREKAPNDYIICDSSRKDKIYELQMHGLNVLGGTHPILDGIELLQDTNIFVSKDSVNIQAELSRYAWAKDRATGKSLNMPEDKNNHAIDAIRYPYRFYKRNIG